MNQAQRDIKRKLKVLEHVKISGNVSKTCRYFSGFLLTVEKTY